MDKERSMAAFTTYLAEEMVKAGTIEVINKHAKHYAEAGEVYLEVFTRLTIAALLMRLMSGSFPKEKNVEITKKKKGEQL